jgi:sialate O-acetylesterase
VYLAGGQSNMQFPVYGQSARQHDAKGNALAQIAADDALRFAAPRRMYFQTPTNDVELVWRKSSRAGLERQVYEGNHEEGSISAVAWYFARYVREAAKVPVGFVDVSRGGAFIEPSMPPAEVARAKELGLKGSGHQAPGVMWNAMIAPMTMFPFRGVLWYQGESNKNDTNGVYLAKLRALVGGWRREFGNPALPFYYVQLAPCSAGHLAIQLQQAEYEKEDPNAAMVVIADIGNLRNIHPRDKDTIGLRLALRALKKDYGFSDIQDASPEVLKATCDASGKVRLEFANAKWMYVLNEDMSLAADFELMDPAGKWHAARIVNFKDTWIWWSKKYAKNGEFEGNAIELAADGVAQPKAVRYLFNSPWQGSVFNEASLPLGPFEMSVAGKAAGGGSR